MINATSQILKFRNFLIHAWQDLDLLMENHDWDDDGRFTQEWIQVNWEFLVERELLRKGEFLTGYSNLNFRVTYPNAVPTYEVICKPKPNHSIVDNDTGEVVPANIKLIFSGLVKKLNPGYGWYPPFDYVTAFTQDKKQMYRLHFKDIDFFLCAILDE